MPSIIKNLVFVFVLAVFVSVGNLCVAADLKSSGPEPGTQEYEDQVALRVNGIEFTRGRIKSLVEKAIPGASMHSSISDERREKIRVTAVRGMIDDTLVEAAAEKDAEVVASVTKKDIEKEIDLLVKRLPKGMTLKKALKNSKMSKKELRTFLKKDIQRQRLYDKMRKQSAEEAKKTVDDAYVKAYYENNLPKFVEPEQVRLRAILFKADPSGGTREWSAVYKKAKKIVEEARAGADFDALARKHSEDKSTVERGGDMGWQHRGSLMEEMEPVVDKMKPGEVSEPINSLYGFIVVRLEDVKPSVQRKFEEINVAKLKGELVEKVNKEIYIKWLDGLWAKAKIEQLLPEGSVTQVPQP